MSVNSKPYDNFPNDYEKKRIIEIENAIKFFKNHENKHGTPINFIDNAASLLTGVYFALIEKGNARDFIPENNRLAAYKIASATEIVITLIKPVIAANEDESRKINSKFAVYCAISIINNLRKSETPIDATIEGIIFDSNIRPFDLKLSKSLADHDIFLQLLAPPYSLSLVFSNAAWWELMHTFYQFRWNAI